MPGRRVDSHCKGGKNRVMTNIPVPTIDDNPTPPGNGEVLQGQSPRNDTLKYICMGRNF